MISFVVKKEVILSVNEHLSESLVKFIAVIFANKRSNLCIRKVLNSKRK